MAHQSLYRAYRPQSFDDVVGQRHITQTLRNAVAEGTVAHAYLFTGPRGTGKTTTARILAKALNCSKGMSPDPDVSCQDCIDIAEGRHPDVYELDAASRTQVDIVRSEIIDRLAYAPTRGTWKVYIIDEVHMLSNHSFNALLKSIEEPPSHTIFVLCTTHPHKVPETIHSRCQRFDFHRIGIEDIVGRLAHICEREGITVAEGALSLIAKHAG
ncbi:MAG: DNA polymerase III subunit gamma/tau, partial [Actinomycetota bacterium]|nr:DNA polymerase III subunit gamma/tau [Actinomycetota bacterium]